MASPSWLSDPQAALRNLVRMRWAQGVLLAIAAAAAWMGNRELTALQMLMPLALLGVSNLALERLVQARHTPPWMPTAALLLDLGLLTVILSVSGGPMNPFVAAYLAVIVGASLLLGRRGVVAVLVSAVAAYGLLFLTPGGRSEHAQHMAGHLWGMWLATALVGAFAAGAILAYRSALAAAEEALREAEAERQRGEQLAALGTLAAGAAHELATPLSTIAVVAKELELQLEDPQAREDAALLREEVGRCRGILSQMAVQVGASPASFGEQIAVRELIDEALTGVLEAPEVELVVTSSARCSLKVPGSLMASVVRSLVRNAQQASSPDSPVQLLVDRSDAGVRISVKDRGKGMDAATLARALQPFFTTKETGAGMGLGLFVADSVARQLGGRLLLESAPGQGTTATLELPLEVCV